MAYLFFILLFVFTGAWLYRRAPESDKKFIALLFFAALAVRCSSAVLFTNISLAQGYMGFVSGDDRLYSLTAMDILNDIIKGRFTYHILFFGKNIYTYVLTAFYFVFGFDLLASKFINCYIGSVLAMAIYFITYRFFDHRAARIAGAICAFYPSFIYWSSHNFKEPLIELSVCFGVYLLLKCLSLELRVWDLISLAAFSLLILNLQLLYIYQAGFIIIASVLSYCSRVFRYAVIAALVLLALFIFAGTDLPQKFILFAEKQEWAMAISDKAGYYLYPDNFSESFPLGNFNPAALVIISIKQLGYFLFSPFPWAIRSYSQLLALPQIIAWYVLFLFSSYAFLKSFKDYAVKNISVLIFIFTGIFIRAMMEGNVGAALRHRDHFSVIIFIYSALGIVYLMDLAAGRDKRG